MNRYYLLWLAPTALLLAGCNMYLPDDQSALSTPSEEQKSAVNEWLVNDIRDAAINNAIITQHTLFPYHFEAGREDLNELGDKDLAALAEYYRARPGELSIRRGDASEELYKARVDVVAKRLADSGVETGRMKIVDVPAGGEGMRSDRVVKILQESETQGLSKDDSGSGSSSSSNSNSTSGASTSGTNSAGMSTGGQP